MCCFAEEISRSALAKAIISVEQVVRPAGRPAAMDRMSVEQRSAAQRLARGFENIQKGKARAQTYAGPNANESFNELVFFVKRDRGRRK